jgi:anti-anti-sigma factor
VTKEDRSSGAPSKAPKAAVAVFSGEIDIASKEELRRQLDALAGVRRLCLDLSEVQYIDSTAIGELIRLHKVRLERGFDSEVVVVGQNQPIHRLLNILHMETLFPIEQTVPESYRATNNGVVHREIAFRDGMFANTDKK